MPQIFTTRSDSPYDVEIANVGVLGASARGGIPVERAARTVVELQDEDGRPLKGKALEQAAEDFAKARGLATKSLKAIDEEKLRVESGAAAAFPSIEEVSREVAERERGQAIAHAENAEAPPLSAADLPAQETTQIPEPPGQEAKH